MEKCSFKDILISAAALFGGNGSRITLQHSVVTDNGLTNLFQFINSTITLNGNTIRRNQQPGTSDFPGFDFDSNSNFQLGPEGEDTDMSQFLL